MRPIIKLRQGDLVYSPDSSMATISVRAWNGISTLVLSKTVVLTRVGVASILIAPTMLKPVNPTDLERPCFSRGLQLPALDVWQQENGKLTRLGVQIQPRGGGWPVRLMRRKDPITVIRIH